MNKRILTLGSKALDHPALLVLAITAVLFVITRIPALIFYGQFHVSPEDAGLNSVQVLIQGSAVVFLISLGVGIAGLLYLLLTVLIMALYFAFMRSLFPRRLFANLPQETRFQWVVKALQTEGSWKDSVKRVAQSTLRAAPIYVPLFTLIFATLLLVLAAYHNADDIKHGRKPGSVAPWSAQRVNVVWADAQPQIRLSTCNALFFMGESGGRVLLYDSNADVTHRIESSQVELNFPEHCGD